MDSVHCGPSCSRGEGCIEICEPISKRNLDADLIDRQTACPRGFVCIQPVCEGQFCSLDGCADAPACQNAISKRSPDDIVARGQFECPLGIDCGLEPIPVCTPAACDLLGCADTHLCKGGQVSKRSAESEILHPICDLCQVVDSTAIDCCGTIVSGVLKRTDLESVCPLYCITTKDGETLCGCAAQDYIISLQGDEPTK